jgi:hypothetical protein
MRFLWFGTLALFAFSVLMQANERSSSNAPERQSQTLATFVDFQTAVSDMATIVKVLTALAGLNGIGLVVLGAVVWNLKRRSHNQGAKRTSQLQSSADVMTRAALLGEATELALQGAATEEVMDRARFLKQFYGDLLPKNFVDQLKKVEGDRYGRLVTEVPVATTLKKDVIRLLAQHPDQREQIINDFKSVFPYEFLDKLETSKRKISPIV